MVNTTLDLRDTKQQSLADAQTMEMDPYPSQNLGGKSQFTPTGSKEEIVWKGLLTEVKGGWREHGVQHKASTTPWQFLRVTGATWA